MRATLFVTFSAQFLLYRLIGQVMQHRFKPFETVASYRMVRVTKRSFQAGPIVRAILNVSFFLELYMRIGCQIDQICHSLTRNRKTMLLKLIN